MRIHTKLFSISFMSFVLLTSSVFAQTPKNTVLICRSKQCAAAEYTMSKEFLFNKLASFTEHNLGKKILLCEADPVSRVCYNNALSLKANTALTKATIDIPYATLLDAKLTSGKTALDLILDYHISVGQNQPKCEVSVSRLNVDFIDKVQMHSSDFRCGITTTGNTYFNMTFNINYIDFDYGTLGAYYTIASGGAVQSGKSGYILMRFTQNMPSTVSEYILQGPDPDLKSEVYLDGKTPIDSNDVLHTSSVEVIPVVPAVKTNITTKKEVTENGDLVSIQEQQIQYTQDTLNGPVVQTDSKILQDKTFPKKQKEDTLVSKKIMTQRPIVITPQTSVSYSQTAVVPSPCEKTGCQPNKTEVSKTEADDSFWSFFEKILYLED